MNAQELAILFSGGADSLALYALATVGKHHDLPKTRKIHLLHMLNGMSRFHDFPGTRFDVASRILKAQTPSNEIFPESIMVELDMGRLFQGLWLDRYEVLMPRYGGKNLVCVACKLGMHVRGILYCIEHLVPVMIAGYTKKQEYYPEQTPVFMGKTAELSDQFGIETRFPVYDDFTDDIYPRHVLEDLGLPSTGGGERKCLFCQTLTTATEKDIRAYLDDMLPVVTQYISHCIQIRSDILFRAYLDDMLPVVTQYISHCIQGRVKEAADCFPPGR